MIMLITILYTLDCDVTHCNMYKPTRGKNLPTPNHIHLAYHTLTQVVTPPGLILLTYLAFHIAHPGNINTPLNQLAKGHSKDTLKILEST